MGDGNVKWEHFYGQFNKLSRALKTSLEMQGDMLNQCRELKVRLQLLGSERSPVQ